MLIPDPLSRTVKIPIKIVNGCPCLFPDGCLPALKEGTIGEMVVPAHAFEDPKLVAQFSEDRKELFLAAHTELMAQINPAHVPDKYHHTIRIDLRGIIGCAVRFILLGDQQILRRGTKNAKLLPCACEIPSLNEQASSTNHAYALISQTYEPQRISHTGNVSSKVYALDGSVWKSLKDMRVY